MSCEVPGACTFLEAAGSPSSAWGRSQCTTRGDQVCNSGELVKFNNTSKFRLETGVVPNLMPASILPSLTSQVNFLRYSDNLGVYNTSHSNLILGKSDATRRRGSFNNNFLWRRDALVRAKSDQAVQMLARDILYAKIRLVLSRQKLWSHYSISLSIWMTHNIAIVSEE